MVTQHAVTTSAPAVAWDLSQKGQLLLRLYERALTCMDQAIDCIHAGDMEGKARRLIRAQDIVLQLSDALDAGADEGQGRSIAANLERLYLYVYRRLITGCNRADTDAIAEAHRLMATLYDGWRQALTPLAAAELGVAKESPAGRARL